MSIFGSNSLLFYAILAMDAYSRSYSEGVIVSGSSIGTATLGMADDSALAQNASFFAQAYTWKGKTIIAYRGREVGPSDFSPPAVCTGFAAVALRVRLSPDIGTAVGRTCWSSSRMESVVS